MEVVFITQRTGVSLPGVRTIVYKPQRTVTKDVHHYLLEAEAHVLNAQAVARVALDLKQGGFIPDIMIGHNGWGEIWYLKDVYPAAPLLGYFEFFYRFEGADVNFAPDTNKLFDTRPRVRTKNIGNLLGLDAADFGQCPTVWQKTLYPQRYHPMLHVVHEGIDTAVACPAPKARLSIPDAELELDADDEIVTYVARNLEPYRGFPTLMRSLPEILGRRPNAHVVIVGGDESSYGDRLPEGQTHRQRMLDELGDALDCSRVHFLGKVPHPTFITLLRVSSVHIYLTYPFVLSWSMLEAMATGCLVVASRTAPVEEVIRDGYNGLLVDFFSPRELADRVVAALADPAAFAPLRHRARRTVVDNYDLRTVCLPGQLKLIDRIVHP